MNLQTEKTGTGLKVRKNRSVLSKRIPRIGWVVFSDQSNPVHCAVKEFTENRAILTMSGWLGLPSSFTLYVEPDSIRAQCKVVRSSGSNVEVLLSELEDNIRFRSSHVTVA
ncbi:MAG: hypothetical protein AAGA76_01230 [Pseudomonadota bacterium]